MKPGPTFCLVIYKKHTFIKRIKYNAEDIMFTEFPSYLVYYLRIAIFSFSHITPFKANKTATLPFFLLRLVFLCVQKVNCISAGHKRLAEARLLLYRLAYEKAKLQLMHLKHQKIWPYSTAILI